MRFFRTIPSLALTASLLSLTPTAWSQNTGPASPDQFMTDVLTAIQANDKPALQKLMVTEEEFKKYIWPKLPGYVRESQSNPTKYYKTFSESSNAGIDVLLRQYGGQNLKFVKASFGHESNQKNFPHPGQPNNHGNSRRWSAENHPDCFICHYDGTWKVANYFVTPGGGSGKP